MVECDGCTLCCKLSNVPYMSSPQGEYCLKCRPDVGCTIHKSRPEDCKIFQCAYSQMEKVNFYMRPDKCGIMFEKISDTLILGTIDGKIDEMSKFVKGQITSFGNEGISTMVQQFNTFKWVCFTVPGAKQNDIIRALEDKANDCAKLY